MPFNKKLMWKREKLDTRDYIFPKQSANKLPGSIDLRSFAMPVEDQGNLGSCTGHAIAESIEILNKKNGKNTEISRLFIYYQERVYMNTINTDSGAYIRDGIKSVYHIGAPLESFWPYNIPKWNVKPSSAAYDDAAKRKVTLYQKCADFTAVKSALAAGFPVMVGYDVYSSFVSYKVSATGIMPYPNTKVEALLGGHAVSLVGYNDNFNNTRNGYFIAKNSWGPKWGDKGYFYMPYSVIQNTRMSSDFWAITKVNNP